MISEFDELIGFTVSLLPIRSKPTSPMLFSHLVGEYRAACLGAYLLQRLEVPRRTSHSPVSQITVNYQTQGAFPQIDFGDIHFTSYDHYNARLQSDFGLDVEVG